MPKDWSAEEYFEGCFGIIADHRTNVQTIKLKVNASQANYIRDLRLHESQDEIERNEEYSLFAYQLRPSYDVIQELRWHAADMEVLEPQSLREDIANIIEHLHNKYNKCETLQQ